MKRLFPLLFCCAGLCCSGVLAHDHSHKCNSHKPKPHRNVQDDDKCGLKPKPHRDGEAEDKCNCHKPKPHPQQQSKAIDESTDKCNCHKPKPHRDGEAEDKCNCHKPRPQQKEIIQQAYTEVAESDGGCSCGGCGCCGGGADLSKLIGYSAQELASISDANLGLGCGNPISLGDIKSGMIVVDLGSGAGIDCLLMAKRVGSEGRVIGVDMTPAMIKKASENAEKYNFTNVEFVQGDIEALPLESSIADIVMSNCVINLATDKMQVFREAYRVLKPSGKMFISDVVLTGDLTPEQRNDAQLLSACVAGAMLKNEYIAAIESCGFRVEVVGEDTTICEKWFGNNDLPISSLKFIAHKIIK